MRAVLCSTWIYVRPPENHVRMPYLGWQCCGRAWESAFQTSSLAVVMLYPHVSPWRVWCKGTNEWQRQLKGSSRKRWLFAHHRGSRPQLSMILTVTLTTYVPTDWFLKAQGHSQHPLKERCQLSSLECDLYDLAETNARPEARAHLETVSYESHRFSGSGFSHQ